MSQTSAERMREWTGPALLSFGFRPFFLFGALWSALAMAMWITMLTGNLALPTRFDPISWHAHEFLFGYLGAIVAGFLLTAVPNWTGRLPVVGWQLGALVLIWLLGRVAVSISNFMPAWLVAVIDLFFPVLLGAMILREIVAGRNWRNLIVLTLLGILVLANGLFHWEAGVGDFAAQGTGLRLGVAAALMMISVIGGRIVPSFTRNWLVKTGHDARPVPPMQRFDKVVLLLTLAGLLFWVMRPDWAVTGLALLGIAAMQSVRLLQWKGWTTAAEPLVWVLHAGYAFVPLGAFFVGLSILSPDALGFAAAQHVWMAGAIGLMTVAVMTRATLGHTGQDLRAGLGTVILFLSIVGSVVARMVAGVWVDVSMVLYGLSAALWIVAFGSFVLLYGPLLLMPKPKNS
ncbi:MAG: NnrS family protein [Hyphomicrobiales bacterium]|nr:NnrS family protein [Hyphomicrobiales bacterium]MCP5000073.1 NnrS family protein [Hyphomicrobiales bacterium]